MDTRLFKNEKAWVYDIETYKNMWCFYFKNVVTAEYKAFLIQGETNMFKELIRFVYSEEVGTLIGFNSFSYDDRLLSYMIENCRVLSTYDSTTLTSILCKASDYIIEGNRALRIRRTDWFESVDLYRLLGFRRSNVSLKRAAVFMGMPNIQDLPYPPGSTLTLRQGKEVLLYNKNDVDVTEELLLRSSGEIKIREFMQDKYGMSFYNADRTYLGKLIFMDKFNSKVPEEYHITFSNLKKWNTKRDTIKLSTVIDKRFTFKTPLLQKALDDLMNTTVHVVEGKFRVWNEEKEKFKKLDYKIELPNCNVTIALGGIHSTEKKVIFDADENTLLEEADIGSMYPNIIVQFGVVPEHFKAVKKEFLETVQEMIDERMFFKHHPNPTAETKLNADILKISINSLYGLYGSKFFAFYDPASVLGVTVNGQISILKAIEELELNDIRVIGCNTDGINIMTSLDNKDLVSKLLREWEELTGLLFEESVYSKMIFNHVNSYLWISKNGKIKQKGEFLPLESRRFEQSVNQLIISDAINNYFLHETPVEKTIEDCEDITRFTISQRMGIEKSTGLRYNLWAVDSEENPIEKQQKTTRFYSATDGPMLKRVGVNASAFIQGLKGQSVRIFNRFVEKPFADYKVDKTFYIKNATKIVADYKIIN